MKNTKGQFSNLSEEEMRSAVGGFFFLIPLAVPFIVNTIAGAILASPFAGSVVKGWNEMK